jgi:ribose transport system ATP-binding protein
LLDEPTQGVDVGAKSEIHAELRQIAHSDGASILVTSTDIDELVALCDQILIFKSGRIAGKLSGSKISANEVSRMIVENSTNH